MNLEALLRADRSYRGFSQTERLTDDQLRRLVALTRLTPSTTNLQALKFFHQLRRGNERRYPVAHPLGGTRKGDAPAASRLRADGVYRRSARYEACA